MDANIVALSGIAIAIGTMVDMGIIFCGNILKHLEEANPAEERSHVIFRASNEVATAVLTAVSTTVVSFLPVFTMIAAEGKLFRPLAFTKTFALIASVIVALTIIPPAAHVLQGGRITFDRVRRYTMGALVIAGVLVMFLVAWWVGAIVVGLGLYKLLESRIPLSYQKYGPYLASAVAVLVVGVMLTDHWLPLGPQKGLVRNLLFVGVLIGGLLGFFTIFQRYLYEPILRWSLARKALFLSVPVTILFLGGCAWLGFDRVFSFVPKLASSVGVSDSIIRDSRLWHAASNSFPGLGKEFMPPLDEGASLQCGCRLVSRSFSLIVPANSVRLSIDSPMGTAGRELILARDRVG